MTAETLRGAREVAMASFEGAIRRDADRIVASAHPEDYVDDLVAGGEFRGKEAVRAFFEELFAAMPISTSRSSGSSPTTARSP